MASDLGRRLDRIEDRMLPVPRHPAELHELPRWLSFDEIIVGQRALQRFRGDPGLALDSGDPIFCNLVALARARRDAVSGSEAA